MTEMDDNRLTIGGNNPPLEEVLRDQYAALLDEVEGKAAEASALIKSLEREVKSEDDLAKVGDFVVAVKAVAGRVEKTRVAEKEPHLKASRAVDAFFGEPNNRLKKMADVFTDLASDYQRRKAAEARRKADEEARKLREEEDRKRQEAEAAKRSDTAARKTDEADEIAERARRAEAEAREKARNVETVKSETGVSIGAKTEWTYRITDFDIIPLDKLRHYFPTGAIDRAISDFLKKRGPKENLPGVEFFEDIKANFRR